jgi:hypothetical protein
MGCAQCHSHKFDPISQQEYYQFYALFNQTEDNDQPNESPLYAVPSGEDREKMDALKKEIAALEQGLKESSPELEKELARLRKELQVPDAVPPHWLGNQGGGGGKKGRQGKQVQN